MRKKSKWVRCRDAVFNALKSLFTKVVGFIRSDPELKRIFKLAGAEIISRIKALEENTDMSGSEKLVAVREATVEILKKKGEVAGKYILNTVIEMLLVYIRGR